MTAVEKARTARLRFTLRRLIFALLFTTLGFLSLDVVNQFVPFQVSVLITFYGFVAVLTIPMFLYSPAALRFFCPFCEHFLSSGIPWVCGFCKTENYATKVYSFLSQCRSCGRSPKAFQCPSCSAAILFNTNSDTRHMAFKVAEQQSGETAEEFQHRRAFERQERAYMIELLDFEAALIEKQTKVKTLRRSAGITDEDPQKARELRYRKVDEGSTGIFTFEKKMLAQYEKEFADDPHLMEQKSQTLKYFVESELAELQQGSNLSV